MIKRLDAANMLGNTIWLLTTDNGAPVCVGHINAGEGTDGKGCGGRNGLLRGSKMTDWVSAASNSSPSFVHPIPCFHCPLIIIVAR